MITEYILAFSMHVGMGEPSSYNYIHPQIRVNHDDYIAGVYLNSHSEPSAFVGHRWESGDWGIAPAIHEKKLGAVVGYEWKF